MNESTDFIVSEAKDDRDDLKREIRDAVGDGCPCTLCGAIVLNPDGLSIHVRWHLRLQEVLP